MNTSTLVQSQIQYKTGLYQNGTEDSHSFKRLSLSHPKISKISEKEIC